MLGSRKLLIVLLSCIISVSVFVLGLSAEELVRDDPLLLPAEERPVLREALVPEYSLNSNGVLAFSAWLVEEGYTSSDNVFNFSDTVYYFQPSSSSGVLASNFYVTHSSVFCTTAWGSVTLGWNGYTLASDSPIVYDFLISEVGLSDSDFVFRDAPSTIFSLAYECFVSILGVGSSLVAFVIARPIVLIPIVALLLVLSYGVIRRLIKGV